MAHPQIYTAADLIQHGIQFLGGNQTAQGQSVIRTAIHDALRELTEMRRWNYLLRLHRISVPSKYSTGSISYTHSTRALTLSGGTWPSWAASGAVEIANRVHRVSTRDSDTVLTLHADLNPGENVSASTPYVIFQNRFSLPTDYVSQDMPYASDRWKLGRFSYVRPNDFLAKEAGGEGSGAPWLWTIMEDPDNTSRMAVWTWRPPEAAAIEDLDFLYYRRPRQLVLSGYKLEHQVGKVSTTGTTTLTGSSTQFASSMVGSVVRVSDHSTRVPTGIDGIYPFAEERFISAYTSATSLTVDEAFSLTQSLKAYIISDPVDVDGTMITALKRGIEAHLATVTNMRNKQEQVQIYDAQRAMAASIDESRVYKPREPGDGRAHGARPPDAAPPDEVA